MEFNFSSRLRKLRTALKKNRLDALVVVTVEGNNKNVYYLSGFGGTTGALVISKTGAVLAVDARYTARAKKEIANDGSRKSIISVVEIPKGARAPDFAVYVETALLALKLSKRAKIGFEGARVPVLMAKSWAKYLKRTLIPTRHVVERLRQTKDADEINALAHAGRLTSEVFVEVARKIKAGMRERDIAFMIDVGLRAHGAVGNSFETIVASGANSAIPHHETSERKVRAGEPVVLDFGGTFPGGYCSDLTRTIFVPGKSPNQKLIIIYDNVLQANKRAFKALKPGMTWKEYDAVARDHIKESGYGKYFTHGLGHSLGLEAHDPYDYTNDAFQVGTVLSNEPGIYIEGLGGIRTEDDVVVTAKGARRLTLAPYLVF